MIKSALIFVPHPDDEINLGGGLFETLYNNGVFTTVVICTNGDSVPQYALKRFNEARKTKSIFKYQELIFLGYGDGYINNHIYDIVHPRAAISVAGEQQTYCVEGNEYCFETTGEHHSYNRDNYKKDIYSVIINKKADLVLCVDIDSHLDHKCLSLLFDECMGEIIKKDSNYKPIVLKGFAYNGVWSGPYDFFDVSIKPTSFITSQEECLAIKTFPYNWDDRIRLKNDAQSQNIWFWHNSIFKALLANRTQLDYYKIGFCALSSFPKIANPDSCYWYRSPYNLSLFANIKASSGEIQYLNDYMLVSPPHSIKEDLATTSHGWTPNKDDVSPSICFTFSKNVRLTTILIYVNLHTILKGLRIKIDENIMNYTLKSCSNVYRIVIDEPTYSQNISILLPPCNEKLVINEIECFEEGMDMPSDITPFVYYVEEKGIRDKFSSFISKTLFKSFVRIVLIFSKIKSLFSL